MTRLPLSGFVLGSLISLTMVASAFATPHHRMIKSEMTLTPSNCTFPDGTSPRNRPEIHCYDPQTFLHAYGIDELHAAGLTGKDQTVILVDSFGSPTMQADLDHFSETFGLPKTTIQFIYPNGPYVNPMSNDEKIGWAGETTLDLEWAHAIAPDATLVNVVTNTAEATGMSGFPEIFKGIEMATKKYPGAILSMSFGTGEPTFQAADIRKYLQGSFHRVFARAARADLTLIASSGDQGSTNVDAPEKSLIPYANASYPATDPYVTAVGGTALEAGWMWAPEGTIDDYWDCRIAHNSNCPTDYLTSGNDPSLRIETVWKEAWAPASSGGGVSTIFKLPAYQSGLPSAILGTLRGFRGIPDTSLNAAINGGVEVYASYDKTGPAWSATGGTSCAAPETAALIALAGQKASDALGRRVGIGSLNPILYSLNSTDFNDIVAQSFGGRDVTEIADNALFYSPETLKAYGPKAIPPEFVPGYPTLPGYDLATGLGSPRAVEFVGDVALARVLRESTPPTFSGVRP